LKKDRKENIKLVKNICIYKPSLIERTGGSRRRRIRSRENATNSAGFQNEHFGNDDQRFIGSSVGRSSQSGDRQRSAGPMTPNQQIYEMYNLA